MAGMLASGLAPMPTWADVGNPAYLSAGMKPDGSYVLCGLTGAGEISFELPLPARGHAAAAHPTRPEAVAFARRPGTYAVVLDCTNGQEKARLDAPAGRHFYGHGTFSANGELLFTTENDFENAQGVVGVWDVREGYRRLGEFWSGGVGPHDIKLIPESGTLVVANGGIETLPESGRTKLNIPTMQPNLSYLNLDGSVLEEVTLGEDLRKNSIRHLAVTEDGLVAFAMQWQGDETDYPPVLGTNRRGEEAHLSVAPIDANRAMRGYAGSVAISTDSKTAAITSPRGGVLQSFDMASLTFKQMVGIEDVCGVAPTQDDFFVTSGLGLAIDRPSQNLAAGVRHHRRWDNHLVAV